MKLSSPLQSQYTLIAPRAIHHCHMTCRIRTSGKYLQANVCARVGHKLSIICSNAENKAWSQHKHLDKLEHDKSGIINLNSRGI